MGDEPTISCRSRLSLSPGAPRWRRDYGCSDPTYPAICDAGNKLLTPESPNGKPKKPAPESSHNPGSKWVMRSPGIRARLPRLSPCDTLTFETFTAEDHLRTMQFWRSIWRFLIAIQLLPALEGGEETLVGGQAVLEGVMMRSPHAWGIAVRKPSGEIAMHSEPLERLSEKHKWMGWPVVRGVITLGHAMSLGLRALRYSANVALDQVQPEPKSGKKLEISGWIAAVNILISVGFFIFMYKFLPLLAATALKKVNPI